MKMIFGVLMLVLFCGFVHNYDTDNTITISVVGIKNTRGTIIINLYNASTGFPTDMSKALQTKKIPASTVLLQTNFKTTNGSYAVSVMHDANNNGKMDKNFFGIPTEGYCVSNNAKGFMSAPSFADAKFNLKSDVTQILKLIY